ncbi:restriction endonuclease [Methanoculleus sp. FWC-SCC1]|uniref:Restriction endonuclease n=1 Tax=Methanoculleus frigidifontis TaxID=2584085 RepID=A0ABT8M628_9EURY|nr:ATP cone domain-containing protein [Methanoculleus sp. FWC-SCC1]MDN7023361.1 restriction endonuclease [Methanoculleus sp. FWC-SCC1]
MKYVTKMNGTLQPFEKKKVERTLRNLGIAPDDAEQIAAEVEGEVYDGMKTSTLLRMIRARARAYRPAVAYRTNLRRALALLRPKPDFEVYIQALLRDHGYEVEPARILPGRCGEHEVDAIARKDGTVYFIEVKHHFNHHRMTGLDEGRIARAIIEDVQEGHRCGKNSFTIDTAMIVCNTKLSGHAKRYATCWGIEHIGWDHPADRNLRTMIEETGSYPVTILTGVTPAVRRQLAAAGFFTVRQLLAADPEGLVRSAGLTLRQAALLAERAEAVLT